MLETGDEAYAAMKTSIDEATRSILLETYIFDRDVIGLRIADALIAAVRRGVEVRVLIDAVGARYSVPSILGHLREGGVTVAVFNGNVIMSLTGQIDRPPGCQGFPPLDIPATSRRIGSRPLQGRGSLLSLASYSTSANPASRTARAPAFFRSCAS